MKWIDAAELDRWSNTNAAKEALPAIVFALARAMAPASTDLRFPHGDSAQLPGFDGWIQSDVGSVYVPRGTSIWEFGTSADYRRKADSDLAERSANPRGIDPATTTFVACTSRRWVNPKFSLSDWEAKAKDDYQQWKAIKLVDAVQLEHWFEMAPAVAAAQAYRWKWAPQHGALSTDQFWEEFQHHFDPALTEAVALAGRSEAATELVERLQGPVGPVRLSYDSPEQVAAFVVAAIRAAPEAARKYLEARTMVVSTDAAARLLDNRSELIFVLQDEARRRSGYLTRGHVTVVPLATDSDDDRVDVRPLRRPTQHEFSEALKTMMPEHEAHALGLIAMGSLTVLRRHRPNLEKSRPAWEGNAALFAATLAGGWDANSDGDQEALKALSASESYAAYEAGLRPFTKLEDAPIENIGSVWAMQAPFDALLWNWKHFPAGIHERLREVTLHVFAQRDASLDLKEGDMLSEPRFTHSEWLRRGLANTLLHLSVLMSEGRMSADWLPAKFIDKLVTDIPGIGTDAKVMASIKDICPKLMEAAPRPLLKALEQLLEGSGDKIKPLFEDNGEWLPAYHTGVLWGLEGLAWDPDYFAEAVMMLGELASIDPGGKLSNRPIASLSEIFVPWSPNTNASAELRAAVLDDLKRAHPDVAWNLVKALLPGQKSFSSPTHKPSFRESSASKRERPTRGSFARDEQVLLDHALSLVGAHGDRWTALLPTLPATSGEFKRRAIDMLSKSAEQMSEADRVMVWEKIRYLIAMQSRYRTAHGSFSETDLAMLTSIMAALQPNDEIERIKHLFDHYVPAIEDGDDDPESAEDSANTARRIAARKVWVERGMSGVRELVGQAALPAMVAVALADATETVDDGANQLSQFLGDDALPLHFLASFSGRAESRLGAPWRSHVFGIAKDDTLSAERRGALIVAWQPSSALWDQIASTSPSVEEAYWKLLNPWVGDLKADELERLARSLMRVDRAAMALLTLREKAKLVPALLVLELLDRAVGELNKLEAPPSTMFVHALEKVFEALVKHTDADRAEIGRREYKYLPLFGYSHDSFVLNELMAKDPEMYVSMLSDVFRPASRAKNEPSEDEQRRGQLAYRVLTSFSILPGTQADGAVDEQKLNNWVDKVIALTKAADREDIGLQYVGHVLAHSPNDPSDGGWPHKVVRRLVDRLKSDEVEGGIQIERFNMRGVVTKAMFEGGKQEREIAAEIRAWAEKSDSNPRMAKVLKQMASSYEKDAEHEDTRAEQDRRRF